MNNFLNDEIECNKFDEEFEEKCSPKLILDGY
jgi:hypothetical protein